MNRMRFAGLALALLAGAVFPTAAGAHTKVLKLEASERYRGYTVRLRALKEDEDEPENPQPVGISVVLDNGVQTHRYTFEAPRGDLIFGRGLRSGTLKLDSLSGPARAALPRASHGGGVIRFAASGPAQKNECSGERATVVRPQTRTSGQLRFSPTRKEKHEFVRRSWSGVAKKLVFGGCASLPPCPKARRLSAYETEGANFGIVVRRFNAGGPLQVVSTLFEIDPDGPLAFESHTRTARADRSRFDVTRLSHGSVDLDGVRGFSGSFHVESQGDPFEHYGPCPGKLKEGTATGDAGAKFAFAPDQSPSSWTGGMIARGRL